MYGPRMQVTAFLLFTLAAILSLSSGCTSGSREAREIRTAFQAAAPQPDWWGRVDANCDIANYDELLACWQSNDRKPREFFKAAYQAILEHPTDDDLVVNAINLMPYGDREYPHTATMLEFVTDHYFRYDRPLHSYGGKSGDTIAGVVRTLSTLYNRAGSYGNTIDLVERLLDTREHEVNDQMLELISLEYAEALHGYGRGDQAVTWLREAIDRYDGDWEKKLSQRLEDYGGAN